MFIVDIGSGETCKNDIPYIKRMIDELKAVDTGVPAKELQAGQLSLFSGDK